MCYSQNMFVYPYLKRKYFNKKSKFLIICAVIILLSFATAEESSGILQSTLVRPDYEFKWVSTLDQNVTLYANYDTELARAGETLYITREKTECNTGMPYLMVIYKGNFWWIKKRAAKEILSVKRPHLGDFENKTLKNAVAGDIFNEKDLFYVYSEPDDSKPENTLAMLLSGDALVVVDENYNSEWSQLKVGENYVCYIRKEFVNFKDSYLAGAERVYQKNIKLAKKANITYGGVLKNYSSTLTKEEFSRLADIWLSAIGSDKNAQEVFKNLKPTDYEPEYSKMQELCGDDYASFVGPNGLTKGDFNALMKSLVRTARKPLSVYEACKISEDKMQVEPVHRDEAINSFYNAYTAPGIKAKGFVAMTDTSDFVKVSGAWFGGVSNLTPESELFIKGRSIRIKSLYVCNHETTQAEFKKYCNYGSSAEPNVTYGKGNNYPAYFVSYYDAIVYCNLRSVAEGFEPCYSMKISGGDVTDVSKWTGIVLSGGKYRGPDSKNDKWDAISCDFSVNGYRLPTEAEWECLARSDGDGLSKCLYSGSDAIGNVAWYKDNGSGRTHEVKQKLANSLGLYDMSGNVKEWCYDWYGKVYMSTTDSGVSAGDSRVNRGGSIGNDNSKCTVAYRSRTAPNLRYPNIGFRVVRSLK